MSGVYQRGIPVNIVERFYSIEPLTGEASLADPTTVVFTTQDPEGADVEYEFGVDGEVANPAVGVYVLTLGVSTTLTPGTWHYLVNGDGAVQASNEGEFTILESGVLDPLPPPYPTPGPCTTWINGDDVADCCDGEVGSNTFEYEDVASMASYLLFELTARQFPGICERTERPCRSGCGCWDSVGGLLVGTTCDQNRRCGCSTESYLELPGWPIRQILEVKIDGDVVAANEYRLESNKRLLRLADPGPPITRQSWPGCQDLTLEDDQEGTFSVRYSYGVDPPPLGRRAAAQLACELWKACPGNAGECALPNKVTRIVRQGVTMEKIVPLAELLRTGATGLQLVDTFIAAANPHGIRRRPAVWSPDRPRSRRVA